MASMSGLVIVAALSFGAAVAFIGYQSWRAWSQQRRWAWLNIALMILVLAGTIGLAIATDRSNAADADDSWNLFSSLAYVTAMAGVVFWFMGLFGGELVYFLTEYLDKRRIEADST